MRKRSPMAERLCHLHSGPLASGGMLSYTHSIGFGNFDLASGQKLVHVSPGNVAELLCRRDSVQTPFFRNQFPQRVALRFAAFFPRVCHYGTVFPVVHGVWMADGAGHTEE